VGKTTTALADVGHNFNPSGFSFHTRSGGAVAYFNITTSDGDIAAFYKDGAPVGSIGTSGNLLVIGDSDCGIAFEDGSTNHLYPWNVSGGAVNDGNINLGASSARFKDLYLSGSIHGDVKFENNAGTTEYARFDSSGNLLVGKATTAFGTQGVRLSSVGTVIATSNGNAPAELNRLTSDGTILGLYKDNEPVGSIGTSGGRVYFADDSTNGITFSNSSAIMWPSNSSGGVVDDTMDIGSSSYRFDDIYATNGTIQTSDRNEKQDIAELSDAEQRVAVAAKGLLRKFRWKDRVAEKGDEARTHFGIIAQDLQAAFVAEGLDAGDYAMFISSTWTDEETGEERTRMGVRYSELLAFIIAAI